MVPVLAFWPPAIKAGDAPGRVLGSLLKRLENSKQRLSANHSSIFCLRLLPINVKIWWLFRAFGQNIPFVGFSRRIPHKQFVFKFSGEMHCSVIVFS